MSRERTLHYPRSFVTIEILNLIITDSYNQSIATTNNALVPHQHRHKEAPSTEDLSLSEVVKVSNWQPGVGPQGEERNAE